MIESGGTKLLRLLQEPIETVIPKGWKSTAEWAKEIGLGEVQTGRYLRSGVKEGLFEKRQFKVGRYTIDHYKKKA